MPGALVVATVREDGDVPTFSLVTGEVVREVLAADRGAVLKIVEEAYLAHGAGESVNPDSYFLRFPEKPDARIIALPAYLGGGVDLAGIKWIGSFPANTDSGLPRASAVLILNDYATGYPVACLEAATISSARTAASAALAARVLATRTPETVGVVGAGVIARNICDYLLAAGVRPDRFLVHDLDRASGEALVAHVSQDVPASFRAERDDVLSADVVVFATTALAPHVLEPFRAGQLVLNISLRDLAPEVVLASNNVLDDIEHCLKADTSPHLAERLAGSRDFVSGTLPLALAGSVELDPGRATVFSPFGLGVLDIAVGAHVLAAARATGRALEVPGFFGETTRW